MDPEISSEQTALFVSSRKALSQKVAGLLKTDFPELHLTVVSSGVEALNLIYECPPSVVIVDSQLSDLSGMQMCRVLKHDPPLQRLPVMLIVKENLDEYQRYTEFSIVADTFVEEHQLKTDFVPQLKRLIQIFKGLDASELQTIRFLQQKPVKVQSLNRVIQLCDQSITEVALMERFRRLFEMVSSRNILHHMLFSLLETVLDYDVAGIFFNDKTREPRLMTYHTSCSFDLEEETLENWTQKIFDQLQSQTNEPWAFQENRFEWIAPEKTDSSKAISPKHLSVFPFFNENTLVGALVFLNRQEIHYELIFPFSLVLEELSALMRIRRYYSEAQMLSMSDALTELYTHPHFLWCLSREIRQAKRYNVPLSLAILSVDNLKQINAEWGYEFGDQLMKHVAHQALKHVRGTDLLARTGGKKIMALFSNTPASTATIALERMKEAILDTSLSQEGSPIPICLSIGLTQLDDTVRHATDLMIKAQKALDVAQQKGHNDIHVA